MGMIAGAPLISRMPFAVTKCSACQVSNESPVSQAPSPVTLKSATVSYCNPCCHLLTESTQKTLGLQRPSVSSITGIRNKRIGMPAYGQVGSAMGGQ